MNIIVLLFWNKPSSVPEIVGCTKQIKIKVILFCGFHCKWRKKKKGEKLGLKVAFFNLNFSERFPNSDNLVWLIIIVIVPNRVNSQGGFGIKCRGFQHETSGQLANCSRQKASCGGQGRKPGARQNEVAVLASVLPTLTAAITGDAMTDRVTPPVIAKFLLCLEVFLPSYLLWIYKQERKNPGQQVRRPIFLPRE